MTYKIENLVRLTSYLLSLSEEERKAELWAYSERIRELTETHERLAKEFRVEMDAMLTRLGPAKDSRSVEERENAKDDADADYHPSRARWPGEA